MARSDRLLTSSVKMESLIVSPSLVSPSSVTCFGKEPVQDLLQPLAAIFGRSRAVAFRRLRQIDDEVTPVPPRWS